MFDASDDLGIVVHPVRVDDADVLGRLRAYVHALPEHLLAGQQLRIHAAVEHRVDLAGHHGRDLLIGEAGDVLLEGLEDQARQHLRDQQRLRIFDLALQKVVEDLDALVVRDVGIIARIVHQQDVALVGSVLHVILVQVSLEAPAVEGHALVLLRGAVVVDQVLADRRRQDLVTKEVVDGLVHHGVAGDKALMPALVDRELVPGVWAVFSVHKVAPDVGRGEELRHLEHLRAAFEFAAFHGLGAGVVY